MSLKIVTWFKNNILQIVSLSVLLFLLVITWFFFQTKNVFPEGTHIAIQVEFQNVVRNKLLEKNPLAENIKFHALWTETTESSSQIRAVFSYSFNDSSGEGPVDVTVKGAALINKSGLDSDGREKWEIGSFEVDQTEMNFKDEVLVISPEKETSASSPEGVEESGASSESEDSSLSE